MISNADDIEVVQVRGSRFTSNTYILRHKSYDFVWLVDIGEFDNVLEHLKKSDTIKGVFLTHPHYDHIFYLKDMISRFPECTIFCSSQCTDGLQSSKLNLSYYHGCPIEYHGDNIEILEEGSKTEIFNGIYLESMETPGHDLSCLTYIVRNHFFTGDSFIPNVEVVTKLRGGDKNASKESLKKIAERMNHTSVTCPGHLEMGHFIPPTKHPLLIKK
jgi:hydroxyacylglutathione hydrolase